MYKTSEITKDMACLKTLNLRVTSDCELQTIFRFYRKVLHESVLYSDHRYDHFRKIFWWIHLRKIFIVSVKLLLVNKNRMMCFYYLWVKRLDMSSGSMKEYSYLGLLLNLCTLNSYVIYYKIRKISASKKEMLLDRLSLIDYKRKDRS